MIKIEKHRIFKRYFQKLSDKQKILFYNRINQFVVSPQNKILNTHSLKGDLNGFYSFSLGGDLRVIFLWENKNKIILYKVGTHNQIY